MEHNTLSSNSRYVSHMSAFEFESLLKGEASRVLSTYSVAHIVKSGEFLVLPKERPMRKDWAIVGPTHFFVSNSVCPTLSTEIHGLGFFGEQSVPPALGLQLRRGNDVNHKRFHSAPHALLEVTT